MTTLVHDILSRAPRGRCRACGLPCRSKLCPPVCGRCQLFTPCTGCGKPCRSRRRPAVCAACLGRAARGSAPEPVEQPLPRPCVLCGRRTRARRDGEPVCGVCVPYTRTRRRIPQRLAPAVRVAELAARVALGLPLFGTVPAGRVAELAARAALELSLFGGR